MARRGRPNITIRTTPELWEAFGESTDDRSGVLRSFMEWYTRRPGAKLPRRPGIDRSADGDQDDGLPRSPA